MKLTIEIELDNDAFRQNGWERETASILFHLVRKLQLEEMDKYGRTHLLDSNGNTVGSTWIGES